MFGKSYKSRGWSDEISSDGSPTVDYSNPVPRWAKPAAKALAIASGLAAFLSFCYRVDRNIDEASEAERNKHFYSAEVLIPMYEKESNFRLATQLENEAWSFLGDAKRGRWRLSSEDRKVLTEALNNNNTIGAQAGEPLN